MGWESNEVRFTGWCKSNDEIWWYHQDENPMVWHLSRQYSNMAGWGNHLHLSWWKISPRGHKHGGWDSCIKNWQITNKQQGSMWVRATSFVNQQIKIGFQTLRLPKYRDLTDQQWGSHQPLIPSKLDMLQCPKHFYLWTTLVRHWRRACFGGLMAHECRAISVEKITKFLPFHQLSLRSAGGYRADLAIAEPLPEVGRSSLPSPVGALPEPGKATYFSGAPQVATRFPQPDQPPSPSGATGPSGAPHIHGKSRHWGRQCISQCCAAWQWCTVPSFGANCTSLHAARQHHRLADPAGSVHIFPSRLESDTHPPTWKGTQPLPERSLDLL